MTMLLTGFDAFGGLAINASQVVVEAIAARQLDGVRTAILPTAFAEAEQKIRRLIGEIRPHTIMCVGVATGAAEIQLERFALNFDESDRPDNAGDAPRGRRISPGGPTAYSSTLPLELLRERLHALGISVRISNFAGTYVCNHVFYVAREEVECLASDTLCGFIHIPSIAETPDALGLPLPWLVDAIACCLDTLLQITRPSRPSTVAIR